MLLGEAWKSLPLEDREAYSTKAKVLADEQKKIYPDCWKRKKTVATSTTVTGNTPLGDTPTGPLPPGHPGSSGGPGPVTKTIATTASIIAGTNPTGVPGLVAPIPITRPLPLPPGIPRHPSPLEVAAQRMDSSPLDIV